MGLQEKSKMQAESGIPSLHGALLKSCSRLGLSSNSLTFAIVAVYPTKGNAALNPQKKPSITKSTRVGSSSELTRAEVDSAFRLRLFFVSQFHFSRTLFRKNRKGREV